MADNNTGLLTLIRQIVQEENAASEKRLEGKISASVNEKITASEKHLMTAIVEQGGLLLDAIEINGQDLRETDKRVDRIEKHLNLPSIK